MTLRFARHGYALSVAPLLTGEDQDAIYSNLDSHADRAAIGVWYIAVHGWRHRLEVFGPSHAIR